MLICLRSSILGNFRARRNSLFWSGQSIALAFVSGLFGEKLVNVESGSIVVEFLNGNIQFNDRFLELEMKETGIYIPPFQKEDFEEKEIVYLGDPLFEKAFIEVYYPRCVANSLYQWQK